MRPTKMNVQLGYMGNGYLDPKIGVETETELIELKSIFQGFIPDGHVVWVMENKAWYVYNLMSDTFTAIVSAGVPGPEGPKGDVGKPGLAGNSFRIDAECVSDLCLPSYCDEEAGFTVLVKGDRAAGISDKLYFKLDVATCMWSSGTDFNTGLDGDDGTSTYFMFAYDTADNITNYTPTDSDVLVTAEGGPPDSFTIGLVTWNDAPIVTSTPGASLYMLKSETYKPNTFIHVPWVQPPVKIDGDEGKSAGIWTIWHDLKLGEPVAPPHDDAKMDTEAHLATLLGTTGWYDDAAPGSSPAWMAVSYLSPETQVWSSWAMNKIAGEKPAYLVNGFKWHKIMPADEVPAKPAIVSVVYGVTGVDIFSPAGSAGWFDNPQAYPGGGETLFQTVTTVPFTGAALENILWAVPINVEGTEGPQGDGTAIWTIWSKKNSPTAPTDLVGTYDAYADDAAVMAQVANADWVADAVDVVDAIWMATCIYVPGSGWTDWKPAKVKGEDGKAFKIDAAGMGSPWVWAATAVPAPTNGFAYLDTDGATGVEGGQLYFLNDDAAETLQVSWSAPIPFGAGQAGDTTYFYFRRSPFMPPIPAAVPDGSGSVSGWSDSVPAGSSAIYMTSIVQTGLGVWGTWNAVIKVEGEDGSEGSGIWTIFTRKAKLQELISTVDLPNGNPGVWNMMGHPDEWVDDAGEDNENLGGEEPRWMAMTRYDVANSKWLPWTLTKIKGEEPAYKVNAFIAYDAMSAPNSPTQNIHYGNGWNNADHVDGLAGWKDAPPVITSQRESLFMSETIVQKDVAGNVWSIPTKLDANDGYNSRQWNIWWASNSADGSLHPMTLPDPNAIIFPAEDGNGTIALPGGIQSGKWVDDISDAPGKHFTYRAVTNRVQFRWSPWDVIRVKGENGEPGGNGKNGNPGAPGGTIVMVNTHSSLGTSKTPIHPANTFLNKVNDPGVTADYLELPNAPFFNTWEADTLDSDAIYLAVMTFGFDAINADSRWSRWRVTRIKGLDAGWDQVNNLRVTGHTISTILLAWDKPEFLDPTEYVITLGGETKVTSELSTTFAELTPGQVYSVTVSATKGGKYYTATSILAETGILISVFDITEVASTSACNMSTGKVVYAKGVNMTMFNGMQLYSDSLCENKWTDAGVEGDHVYLLLSYHDEKAKVNISRTGEVVALRGICYEDTV